MAFHTIYLNPKSMSPDMSTFHSNIEMDLNNSWSTQYEYYIPGMLILVNMFNLTTRQS